MAASLVDIFISVLLPILIVTAFGAGLQKCFKFDIPTLARLNIYLLVPVFLFVKVSSSDLTWGEIGGIAGAVLIPMAMLGVPLWLLMRAGKANPQTIGALVIASVVFNAGNFGLPVAELFYGGENGVRFEGMAMGPQGATDALAVQSLVVMMSNLSIWCIGYVIIALSKGDGWKGALGYFKLPMIYVLVAAFIVKELREGGYTPPDWIAGFLGAVHNALKLLAQAVVPVSMFTLGAQLVQRARLPRLRVVSAAVFLKLIAFPAITFAVVYLMGLWPWPGAQLVIAAAAPTAVNTLLITVELDGDADLAADCVFWTTVVSAVTVTIVLGLLVAQIGVPG